MGTALRGTVRMTVVRVTWNRPFSHYITPTMSSAADVTSPESISTPVAPPRPSLATQFAAFAADIKVSHTIFAMPWAVLAMFLAADGLPGVGHVWLILLCMVFARTAAMASNRLLDARLDALNPRTARRALPAGSLSPRFALAAMGICGIAFITCCAAFRLLYGNVWPLALAVPVLTFLCAYPLLKRFSRLCHYYLGAALGLAPVCAWLAVKGSLAWTPFIMAGAVLLWTAGFDIIYACQDYESDRATGVFSIPSKLGISGALWVARLTHASCLALMIVLGYHSAALSTLYFTGVGIAGVLLIVEHLIVKPSDLSKVGLAFFTINGVISLLLGTLGSIDVFR